MAQLLKPQRVHCRRGILKVSNNALGDAALASRVKVGSCGARGASVGSRTIAGLTECITLRTLTTGSFKLQTNFLFKKGVNKPKESIIAKA